MTKIFKLFWHDSEKTNLAAIEGSHGKFDLTLGKLLVGVLTYANEEWTFAYSDDFKKQKEYSPLMNFPNVEKTYKSSQLWPFFVSRLPGNSQLKETNESEKDIISLLKKYGKHVITNPFVLKFDDEITNECFA